MRTYLIIGACGTGKTWVMQQIIRHFNANKEIRVGAYHWVENEIGTVAVLGKYDGSIFDGSDKLSMSIMSDNGLFEAVMRGRDIAIVCEGDRFTNKTFIKNFNPVIIKIAGNGNKGREQRGSLQTDRQIKSIATRVENTLYTAVVEDSSDCFITLLQEIEHPTLTGGTYTSVKDEGSLF